jgi:hypothetical protein
MAARADDLDEPGDFEVVDHESVPAITRRPPPVGHWLSRDDWRGHPYFGDAAPDDPIDASEQPCGGQGQVSFSCTYTFSAVNAACRFAFVWLRGLSCTSPFRDMAAAPL